MLLSIVIPYFNASKYIYAAVQSILDASPVDAPYEIIIIDDASSEYELQQLHALVQGVWAQAHIPIQIETLTENQGLSGARNHGISMARGEYLFTLDADDFVAKKPFLKVMRDISRLKMDMAFFGSLWFEKDHAWGMQGFKFEARAQITVNQDVIAQYISSQNFYAWRFIAKRELVQQVAYPPRLYMEDVATTTPLLSRAQQIWYEPDQVVYYRQNPHSIMKVWSEKKSFDFLTTVAMLRERLHLTEPMSPALNTAYIGLTCKAYLWACADAIRHKLPDALGVCARIKETHIQTFGAMDTARWQAARSELTIRQFVVFKIIYHSPWLYQLLLKAKTTLIPKK